MSRTETYDCMVSELLKRHGILGTKTVAVHLIYADPLVLISCPAPGRESRTVQPGWRTTAC